MSKYEWFFYNIVYIQLPDYNTAMQSWNPSSENACFQYFSTLLQFSMTYNC